MSEGIITQKVFKWEYLDYTPSTLFFLIEGDVLVWWIDIRHNIDAVYLQEYAWHIWYGIRPSKRKQWYATRILELWLKEAQKLEIQKALVCCYDNNIGSNKVIQVNGGILEKKAKHEDGTYFNRYWITL